MGAAAATAAAAVNYSSIRILRVRVKIIGNEIIKTVGKSWLCMVSKLPIIFKRTRTINEMRIDDDDGDGDGGEEKEEAETDQYIHQL